MADSSAISFSGIASGLDTNAIISTMLKVDQSRIDGLTTQRKALETQISVVGQLRAKILSFQSKLDALRFQSQIFTRNTSTDTPSGQASVVNATATSSAQVGTSRSWVDQLATTTKRAGGGPIGTPTFDPSGPAGVRRTDADAEPGPFTMNGSRSTRERDQDRRLRRRDQQHDQRPDDADRRRRGAGRQRRQPVGHADEGAAAQRRRLATAITLGSAGDTSNFLNADQAQHGRPGGDRRVASTTRSGAPAPRSRCRTRGSPPRPDATGTFTINGVCLSYDASVDTLNSIVGKINGSAANVTASYDAVSDQITLTSKETGAQSIAVADGGGGNLMARSS